MGNKAAHIIRAEINQIKRLLEDKEHQWTDKEIMDKLKLQERTYYRYKLRLELEDKELWQKIRSEPLEKRALDILTALNDCYDTCNEIRLDAEAPTKDRIEASKMMVKAKVNIYYLLEQGPSPNMKVISNIDNQSPKEKLEYRRLIR